MSDGYLEVVPPHWPPRFNPPGHNEPCDMIFGPCCCGAWHTYDEEWVKWGLTTLGRTPRG